MKNWEKAAEVYEEGEGYLGQVLSDVLRKFTIDPDAEWVEPAKPEASKVKPIPPLRMSFAEFNMRKPAMIDEIRKSEGAPTKPRPDAEYDAGWVGEWWDTTDRCITALPTLRKLAAEAARREREKWARRADTIVCIANGEDPGGYEDSTAMIAVRALRAERDRMAAELAAVKAQPSADLAGIVERARKYAEVWNHDTVTTLIYDLAQAVAGMGGGK